ncbi:MAG TPA: UDP-N-acetylmuramate dehydrogenase [Acidimicrobiales bacterium]|jgi:UDP-N-acetylmuramate dehydrogenase|nr:UDP-N-acetylmuramate dehydrogenase [Acidimicrobiales bacterium]
MTAASDELGAVGEALGSRARRDAPLGARTTYRVGGTAALLVEPVDEEELEAVARALDGSSVPVLVLGRGSNLLVADRGFAGLVVALGDGFEAIDIQGRQVRAGAAVSLPVLARRTAAAGLSGLEWAVGVPGSVGGAVCMNAGGHGSDTAGSLVGYRRVDLRTATVADAPADRLQMAYRHTSLAASEVVVAARFRLVDGDPERGAAAIAAIVRWRRANQPGGSNAGSVFTNPAEDSAGRLVEAAGLKGFRLGSAQVSEKHANFIQADEDGSADDVAALIAHVQATVAAKTGVDLRTEVRMVGFDSDPPGQW